jgi:ABC-type hemin transport system ATPase subunit
MNVTRLRLTNLRAIESFEFRFEPGFNLIVGVNGVGKSTVLDALGVCLSAIVRHANRLRAKSGSFLDRDIREGARALTAECEVKIGDSEYTYLIHKSHGAGEAQASKAGIPREQALDTPDRAEFVGRAPRPLDPMASGGHPFGVLFSTRRAVPHTSKPSSGSASGRMAAAYADAFSDRELRLSEFASWMRAQRALSGESLAAERVLQTLENMVRRFLPGYLNIRATEDEERQLLIDHGEKTTVRVVDLSDGERASLKEAFRWADNWMALNWDPDPTLTEAQLETANREKRSSVFAEALARFLPNCENLRTNKEGVEVIDRNPTTLDIAELSDGERGTLALVLDLTRRLAQANPEMQDPAAEAEAVVLIDEIDLHLHPNWQRQIVRNLVAAFPRCQFIATTHSPQVIGEVQHDRIQIIAQGRVYSPTHSYGVDSSRVLEEIMEAGARTDEARVILSRFSLEVGKQHFESARALVDQLAARLGEDDPEVTRARTLLEFMEGRE